ncbi:protein hunchback-like [Topomyia yanbarensis]|uniref:protein hunchback-like n=1 Tax=Topomyia yanbarensis TaxID=2498891 RepID=UPI00273C8C18|nr:protein hunchback-like [Topomyia yanbarensis]
MAFIFSPFSLRQQRTMQNYDSIMSGSLPQQQQQPNAGGWYDMTIKSEPLDTSNGYGQQFASHHHNHQHHHHQQDTPMSHSSPTSPQSVDSMDSLSGRSQYYDAKSNTNGLIHGYNPLGFNPLTPPGYAGMFVPHPQQQQQQPQQLSRQTTPNRNYNKQDSGYVSSTLTPTHTPPMDVTPPKSPKDIAETPEKEEDNGSDCGDSYEGSDDEEGIRKPKINSHGKVKKFKCKQCEFVAVTKLSFWEHTRSHIKPEKMLSCPKCPFVTEYKHHLEYHLRNHQRSKPFQCSKCSYSCVNKSMLNSHMKSHSNVFQFRCADCNYATKYCHSLKLHLRKYAHKPGVVLNMDGTPNPLPIIDVYGTRRGPKTKLPKSAGDLKSESRQPPQSPAQAPLTPISHPPVPNQNPFTPPSGSNLARNLLPHQLLQSPLANMFKNAASSNLPLFPYLNLNFQMFADQQAAIAQLSPNFHQQFSNQFHDKLNNEESTESPSKNNLSPSSSSSSSFSITSNTNNSNNTNPNLSDELLKQITAAAADSSNLKAESHSTTDTDMDYQVGEDLPPSSRASFTPQTPSTSSGTGHGNATTGGGSGSKNRRKGRAFKLERLNDFAKTLKTGVAGAAMENSEDEHTDEDQRREHQQQPAVSSGVVIAVTSVSSAVQTTPTRSFECKYCDISFKNDVMYTIHMGYHGYDDVYKCNMCGEKSEDRIGFFLHIARKAH